MKKSFFVSLILISLVSACSKEEEKTPLPSMEYRVMVEKCDQGYKERGKQLVTTTDMINEAYNLADCYEGIFNKIVENSYSKHSEEMKSNFSAYLKKSYDINEDIFYAADFCTPRCGSIYGSMYSRNVASDIKTIILRQLDYLDLSTQ